MFQTYLDLAESIALQLPCESVGVHRAKNTAGIRAAQRILKNVRLDFAQKNRVLLVGGFNPSEKY